MFQSIAGTLTTSVSSLNNFKECYVNHSATAQWFTVSGSSLTGNVVVTAPENYEVSTDLNRFYSRTLTITANGTLASTKIFVRFSPNSTGSKTGNVEVASSGSTTKTISVSGTGSNFTGLSSYYPASNTTGAALKTALFSAINAGVKSFGYGSLYTHYPSTDTYYDGKVWDVYSTRVDAASPFTFTHGQKQCGNYSSEGDCYNREHTMPQSWFKESSPMVSDIHHILPTDGKVNGMRSNFPFGEVSSPTYTSQQGAKLGNNTTAGYNGTVFEPLDEYKGDIARGLLYMAVRYEDKIAGWSGNGNAGTVLAGNSFPAYDQWFIDLLIKWHNQDPPSNREIIRNNYIAGNGCQNNRNPFIDSPQYAQRIWGGNLPAEPSVIATGLALSNQTATSLTLSFKSGDGFRRLVVIRPSSAAAVAPTDNKLYVANASIASAQVTGSQNYVVYNGTSSSVTITGLTSGTNYTINVYEYNGWYSTSNYRTSTFATISTSQSPVSVEWGTLTASKQTDKSINLDWSTLKETDNSLFETERSINNGPFVKINTKTPAGNSTTVQNYQVVDDTLKKSASNDISTLDYRIKQISMGGDFSYSNTSTVTNSIIVPDTLVWGSFTAVLLADKKNVQLNWSTLKEQNNLRFEVEKGSNNSSYALFKTVASKGNSSNTQTYTLTDTATSGLSLVYYRIKQVCADGKNSYSIQQQVNLPTTQPERKDSVSISGFDATVDSANLIKLSWTVNYEGKTGFFDLLRSIDNKPYYVIRSFAGVPHDAPTTSLINDDTLQKNQAIQKLVYRLRYTGASQSYVVNTDTQMVAVLTTGLKEQARAFTGTVYPMPFQIQLNVALPVEKDGTFDVSLTNLLGQQVMSRTLMSNHTMLHINDLETLPNGVYILSLQDNAHQWHIRVIKQ